MAKIVKTKWNNINGGTDRTDIYPITSDRAVYNADNKTMRQVIRERGVVNISTYFTYDGTPEVLTLETALKKITEENRCPGFLATILTSEGWWTFRYSGYTVDDTTWYNTDNWVPFHAGWLKTDTTSEDPETPLHLEWVVKNYIYTLKGWIDSVSTERNGYFTAEDYKKFLQALEDIKNLQERMAAAEATIKNHEERLVSAEESIKDHESRLVSAENRITSVEGRITSAEGRLDNVENSINSINNSITSINSSISSLQGSITSINNSITNINAEIGSLKDSLANLKIATVVQELPTSNINTNTIYLVPAANQENMNMYAEYVYADGAWEKLGEMQLEVDLSGYVPKNALDAEVGALGYIKSEDIPTYDAGVTSIKATSLSSIITAMPTGYSTGQVNMQIGVDEDALKTWISDNGFVEEKDINVYPNVDNNVTNPTDIYFTSNQLITGSVSGDLKITFHSTNGIAGAEVQIILKAGSSGATITIAGNYAVVTDDYTIVTVEANKYVELNAIYDGSKIYVRSSSKES